MFHSALIIQGRAEMLFPLESGNDYFGYKQMAINIKWGSPLSPCYNFASIYYSLFFQPVHLHSTFANLGFRTANMNSTAPKPVSIGIIGGGICGLLTAISLLKYPHINIQIYESAPAFGEIGAGITIGPNAQRALQKISPEVYKAFEAIATRTPFAPRKESFIVHRMVRDPADHPPKTYLSGQFQKHDVANAGAQAYGPNADQEIYSNDHPGGAASVHRARYLEELVKFVPPERCHFGKRLEHLATSPSSGPVRLNFRDGTTATADAVIGTDGLHSVVRQHVLGSDHPAANPVFAGHVSYRRLVPMTEARAFLSEEEAGLMFYWWGRNKVMLSYPIDDAKLLNLAVIDSDPGEWTSGPGRKDTTVEERQHLAEGWSIGSQAAVKVRSLCLLACIQQSLALGWLLMSGRGK